MVIVLSYTASVAQVSDLSRLRPILLSYPYSRTPYRADRVMLVTSQLKDATLPPT